MTENHYSFVCPIKGEAVEITHCQKVHSTCTKGRAQDCTDKLCAVAQLSWMCPFRNAVRFMGLWSKPENFPRWSEPRAKPDTLPRVLIQASLARPMPDRMDYRRAGAEEGCFDAHLKGLAAANGIKGAHPTYEFPKAGKFGEKRSRAAKKDPETPTSSKTGLEDVGDFGKQAATAINKRLKKGRVNASLSPESSSGHADTQKQATQHSARKYKPADVSKPMTLAERARLMREKKEATGK